MARIPCADETQDAGVAALAGSMLKPLDVLNLYPGHDYTLGGVFDSRAAVAGDRPFVFFRGKSWSYPEFRQASDSTARMLAARGIKALFHVNALFYSLAGTLAAGAGMLPQGFRNSQSHQRLRHDRNLRRSLQSVRGATKGGQSGAGRTSSGSSASLGAVPAR